MNAWRDILAKLQAELARNARLRSGVWVLLALALMSTLALQQERLQGAQADYAAQRLQLAAAETALARRDWDELLAAEREISAQLTSGFWQADTEGLAQAQLQQAMRELVARLELRSPRIRAGLSQTVPELPGVCKVQVQLSSEYPPGGELRLVHAVATHDKKLVADRLEMGGNSSRVMVLLSAHFRGLGSESCGLAAANA